MKWFSYYRICPLHCECANMRWSYQQSDEAAMHLSYRIVAHTHDYEILFVARLLRCSARPDASKCMPRRRRRIAHTLLWICRKWSAWYTLVKKKSNFRKVLLTRCSYLSSFLRVGDKDRDSVFSFSFFSSITINSLKNI